MDRRLTARVARVAVVFAAVVVTLAGLAWAAPRPAALETGTNGFVNSDRPGINAHNSPAVAADPAHPRTVVVADRIDTPRFSCSVALSSNGGLTWRPINLPLAPEAPNCFWPDVAFDGDGRLLVLYTATGGRFNLPVGVWLQPFVAGRATGSPTRVAGALAFHARLAVEGRRVLATWVQAGPSTQDMPLGFGPPPNPVVLARSEDGGSSFDPPVQVSEPSRLVAQPTVLIAPGGAVIVGALDLGDDLLDYHAQHGGQGGPPAEGRWRVVVWRSDEVGAGFGPASVVADDLVIPQRIIVDLAPTPSLAIDRATGRLYAAWDAGRGDGRDVFLASSSDGGSSWSTPVGVAGRRAAQFLPAVGVAPDGRVDVVFYDRGGDHRDVLAEVRLASSWDTGRSFSTATVSDRPFDSGIGLGSVQGIPLLGSQLAVVSEPGRALAFWADTRQGSVASNVQDLAVALVDVRRPRGGRLTALAAGAAAVMGVLVLASAWRRQRRGVDTH